MYTVSLNFAVGKLFFRDCLIQSYRKVGGGLGVSLSFQRTCTAFIRSHYEDAVEAKLVPFKSLRTVSLAYMELKAMSL